jgi:hypothetical protein
MREGKDAEAKCTRSEVRRFETLRELCVPH